jgi:nucleotide-binding universal stress UspA family protein
VVAEDLEPTAAGRRRGNKLRACASGLADRLGLPVKLVHAMDFRKLAREPFQVPGTFERHLAVEETRLKQAAARMGKATGSDFLFGNPVDAVLKHLEKGKPSLLMLGTHGLKGIRHLMLGSVAEELVRRSKNPVLVLGPNARGTGGLRRPKEVLVATALDPSSRPAEEFAIRLARKLGLKIRLYHCVNATLPVATFADPAMAGSLEVYSGLLAELVADRRKALRLRTAAIRTRGVACTGLLDMRSQGPVPAILRESKGAGLIVLGRHTRGRMSQAFFGSTARSLFLRSPVPVISVPEN